jgi:hypothetical protein
MANPEPENVEQEQELEVDIEEVEEVIAPKPSECW